MNVMKSLLAIFISIFFANLVYASFEGNSCTHLINSIQNDKIAKLNERLEELYPNNLIHPLKEEFLKNDVLMMTYKKIQLTEGDDKNRKGIELVKENFDVISSGTYAYVISFDEDFLRIATSGHFNLLNGRRVKAAGEIEITKDESTGELIIDLISNSSGTYRISDLGMFKFVFQALWRQGISVDETTPIFKNIGNYQTEQIDYFQFAQEE